MTETHGRWQPALEVPGIAALNTGGAGVSVDAVSCASAGNCAAGGQYAIANPGSESSLGPFVVTETDGTWGTAQEVPGIQTMTPGIWAETTSMACPSAGNCAAAGYYNNGSDADSCFTPTPGCASVFEVNERHGSWGQVDARTYNFSYIVSLTCPAAGDCVAAGIAADESSAYPGYVDFGELVSETNGDWARAGVLVLTSASSVNSVSCAKPGYCAAGGTTTGCQACNDEGQTAFVISEWHGTWGKAVTPAGLPRYHPNEPGGATVSAVACPPKVALCIAGGSESPANSNRAQAFIVSQAR